MTLINVDKIFNEKSPLVKKFSDKLRPERQLLGAII